MNNPLHAQIAGGLDDVQRALDVGVNIGVRRVIGIGNGNQGGKVQYDIAAFHRRVNTVRIADVAGEHFELSYDIRRSVIQPAPRVERVVKHEGAHLVALAHERLDQVRPDEAVGPGHQILHFTPRCVSSLTVFSASKYPPAIRGL